MDENYLERCNTIYEEIADHITRQYEKGNDAETILAWIELAASFCWLNPTGRYADGRIENIAFEIGCNLQENLVEKTSFVIPDLFKLAKNQRRKVLHIATSIYNIGGHARLISNWIQKDSDTSHALLIIAQGETKLSQDINRIINDSRSELILLPSNATLLEKASWLREIVQSNVDFIVLHHHPNDVVPIVAFATEECPPIAVLNHADHVFWLGSSIADVVIDFRECGKSLSEKRRFAKSSMILPLPIISNVPNLNREEARKQLGVPDGQVMLLSIGQEYKYRPTETQNFYRTVIKILNKNPEAHMYLMGVQWDEKVDYLQEAKHERLHFLGIIENPFVYEVSSDIYLNGFPYGAGMALLEPASLGVCPAFYINPPTQFLNLNDGALGGIVENPKSEAEYIENVSFLIQHKRERDRLGKLIKDSVVNNHAGPKWREHLQAIYQYLESKIHEPNKIPNSNSFVTEDDLSFSQLSQSRFNNSPQLLGLARPFFHKFALKDLMDLLIMSFKLHNTNVSFKGWRGLLMECIHRGTHNLKSLMSAPNN